MSTFVLVHGSWHDGSAWRQVINRLGQNGHEAFGPTVAGHGKGVCKNVSHAQSTQSIVDFVVGCGLTDVVLVGHSYGGTIISKVAEAIPDRIRRLVYWSGFVLNDGESLNDAVPPHFRDLFRDLAADSPDNSVMLPFPIVARDIPQRRRSRSRPVGLRQAVAGALSADHRTTGSQEVLHLGYTTELSSRHRGHCTSTR